MVAAAFPISETSREATMETTTAAVKAVHTTEEGLVSTEVSVQLKALLASEVERAALASDTDMVTDSDMVTADADMDMADTDMATTVTADTVTADMAVMAMVVMVAASEDLVTLTT
jgi:hypothetical protein